MKYINDHWELSNADKRDIDKLLKKMRTEYEGIQEDGESVLPTDVLSYVGRLEECLSDDEKKADVKDAAKEAKGGRKFEPISVEELTAKLEKIQEEPRGDDRPGFDIYAIKSHVSKDMKVEFDLENFEFESSKFEPLAGLHTFDNGLTFLGITSGGDWENPVFWIVYWDGKSIRGYIPSEGNNYNKKLKSAYGNNEDDEEAGEFDWDKMEADIKGRITKR